MGGGVQIQGVNISTHENLSICNGIVFLTILASEVKYSRWIKNSLGGVKIHQVRTIETSTIQCLCISISETLLHVTIRRQAEISTDIFARLLRYFRLSYKNLTMMVDTAKL